MVSKVEEIKQGVDSSNFFNRISPAGLLFRFSKELVNKVRGAVNFHLKEIKQL